MMSTDVAPRAVLVLTSEEAPLVVAVDGDVPCDLDLVNRLMWLRLAARRVGWDFRVEHVDDELGELLELVGVAACFRSDR
jgi:hypothetical protein